MVERFTPYLRFIEHRTSVDMVSRGDGDWVRHSDFIAATKPVKIKPLVWLNCAALGGGRKLIAMMFGIEFARVDLPKSDDEIDRLKAIGQSRFETVIRSVLEC
jgi:hypothetical protein